MQLKVLTTILNHYATMIDGHEYDVEIENKSLMIYKRSCVREIEVNKSP